MKSQTKSQPYAVKSVARALEILEVIADHPRGLVLTEIGQILGFPISSVHDLVQTLTQREYLQRSDESKKYFLGSKVSIISSAYATHTELISIVDPFLVDITRTVGETTSLSRLEGSDILFIHKRSASSIIQVVNPVGTRLPAHATGSGKCMLALLPDTEIDRIYPHERLPTITPNTITSRTELKRCIAEVAELRYATDNEESVIGVWAVASAIHNHDGSPVGSISIVCPTARGGGIKLKEWSELLLDAASTISQKLGYSHQSLS